MKGTTCLREQHVVKALAVHRPVGGSLPREHVTTPHGEANYPERSQHDPATARPLEPPRAKLNWRVRGKEVEASGEVERPTGWPRGRSTPSHGTCPDNAYAGRVEDAGRCRFG